MATTLAAPASDGTQPTVGRYVKLPPLTHDEVRRLEEMRRAWNAYRGNFEGRKPLKQKVGEPDDNVLVNRCAPIVDKGVSFLFGPTVKIEVVAPKVKLVRQNPNISGDPQDTPGAQQKSARIEAAQAYLDACWANDDESALDDEDEDERMTTLVELAMNGGVCGHTYAKIVTQADTGGDTPSVVVLDPTTITVRSDPDDVNCPLAYTVRFDTTDAQGNLIEKATVYEREDRRAKAWSICVYTRPRAQIGPSGAVVTIPDEQRGDWLLVSETPWPHPWAPIHDCMNLPNPNEYLGIADLTHDLIHLNDVLNYVLSNTNKIGRMHAHPWPFISGATAQDITVAPGDVLCLPAHDQKLEALQAHGDMPALMTFAGDLRSDVDEQSRVPGVALGRLESLPKGNISGVALQLLFQPLIEKTTLKRRLYGSLVRKLCQHLLELGGYGDLRVELHWPNLLPVDDLAAAQTAQILEAIGVSQDTLMQQLGYDPDSEAEKSAKANARQVQMAARGQGMPGAPPAAMPPPQAGPGPAGSGAPIPPGQPGAQPQPGKAGKPQPPVNDPAAVAARQAMKQAVGKP